MLKLVLLVIISAYAVDAKSVLEQKLGRGIHCCFYLLNYRIYILHKKIW